MFRFIHSSDLHLGKPYGQMPEDIRGNLTEARFAKIEALLDLAEREGATHILLAGDTFDAETPSDRTRRQAIRAMARDSGVRWVIMPGNHDSLAADELWRTLANEAPANVILALEPEPLNLAEGVTLLPCPCPARRAGRDLGAWMDGAATPDGTLRIGLAHGGVQSFADDGAADTLAPDRAARAGLDYLALGDWHGQMQVEPRTWYSGTPEADRFKHEGRAAALVVALSAPGAVPDVHVAATGEYLWRSHDLTLVPGTDAAAQVAALMPTEAQRRKALLRFHLSGRIEPDARSALIAALEQVAPDFALLDWREAGLQVEYDASDLDRIDQGGVLRAAAEALRAEAQDSDRSAADRAVAQRALNRLYGYAVESS